MHRVWSVGLCLLLLGCDTRITVNVERTLHLRRHVAPPAAQPVYPLEEETTFPDPTLEQDPPADEGPPQAVPPPKKPPPPR